MFRRALIVAFIVSAAGCSDSKNSDSGQQEKDASSKPADAATATDSGKTPTSGTGGRTGAGNAGSAAANGGSGGKPDSGVITMDSGSPKPADAGAANDDDASQDPGPAPKTCFGTTKLDAYVSDPKLCVYAFATGLPSARGMAFAPNGDLFLSAAKIVVLWDADKNGASDANERSTFAQGTGLNHGIVFSPDAKFVYASSPTTVYRWTYTSGQRQAQGDAQVVVSGIPDGGHSTRTLQFDSQGRLIVSIGSASNVDTTQAEWDTRAQIRRFTIPATLPNGGLAYTAGEVIASGMRNECGIFVDADDRLWGVENGRDNLSDNDLGVHFELAEAARVPVELRALSVDEVDLFAGIVVVDVATEIVI
ncbi:MAG TPA: PQQ-dependent sugar dehydrogenase, partial [Polyangiales bacterium]|nr:PQQ-dependent sugar dehydrogenase [Polyangiales bacterium]